MIFITGGAYQDKAGYAVSLYKEKCGCSKDPAVLDLKNILSRDLSCTSSRGEQSLEDPVADKPISADECGKKSGQELSDILELIRSADIITDIHLLLNSFPCFMEDPDALAKLILKEAPGAIIVSDEIGCGIVPLEKVDREEREAAGRLGCLMAKGSVEVYRVICGVGQQIK